MTPRRRGIHGAAFLSMLGTAVAHDPQPATIQVEVASDRRAQVRLVVPFCPTLRKVVAPHLSVADFTTRFATLPDSALAAAYGALQDSFARQARLVVDGTRRVRLESVAWPPLAEVRPAIQETLPAALYEADQEELVYRMWTIRAVAKLPGKGRRLEVELPRGFETLPPSVEWREDEASRMP